MSWAIGYDTNWQRDVGYGVPALCDHPGCGQAIDRGLSYVCGGEPYGGADGCGLYFCGSHLFSTRGSAQQCERCEAGEDPFEPTPDTPEWMRHKLTDHSWLPWRNGHPQQVAKLKQALSDDAVARGPRSQHGLTPRV